MNTDCRKVEVGCFSPGSNKRFCNRKKRASSRQNGKKPDMRTSQTAGLHSLTVETGGLACLSRTENCIRAAHYARGCLLLLVVFVVE